MKLTKENLIKYLKENYAQSGEDGGGWDGGWNSAIEGIAERFLTKKERDEFI